MDDERAARQVKRVAQALARPRSCHVCSARESKNSISPVTQRQSTVVCVRSGSPTKTRIRTRLAVRYAGTKRFIPDPCLQPRLHPPTAALVVARQVLFHSSTGCLRANSPTSEFDSTIMINQISSFLHTLHGFSAPLLLRPPSTFPVANSPR